eukprot:sb/3475342/
MSHRCIQLWLIDSMSHRCLHLWLIEMHMRDRIIMNLIMGTNFIFDIMKKRALLWTVHNHRAFPVKQKLLNSIFLQISDQVGTKQPPCIIRIPSKKLSRRQQLPSPNHVPHPVSSHTANELPRIISFQ